MNLDDIEIPKAPAQRKPLTAKPRAPKAKKLASLQDSVDTLTTTPIKNRSNSESSVTECVRILHAVTEHLGSGLPPSFYRLVTAAGFVRNTASAATEDAFATNEEVLSAIRGLDLRTGSLGETLERLKPARAKTESWLDAVLGVSLLDKSVVTKFLLLGLSDDQTEGFHKIIAWITEPWSSDKAFFTLKGSAGTGKTFMLRRVLTYLDLVHPDIPFQFTAPTNKATKVLKAAVDKDAVTIYSVLKMSMVEDEDKTVLTAGDTETLDVPFRSLLGVDEASMLSTNVVSRLVTVANSRSLKVLLVGDPAQLRPVGEYTSPAWKLSKTKELRSNLNEVRRFDNEILKLSIRIRDELASVKGGATPTDRLHILVEDHSDNASEGVFRASSKDAFERQLIDLATNEGVAGFRECRVLAWRNKTVDSYNALIRQALGYTEEYHEGELVLLAAPLTTEVANRRVIIATVDEEFEVTSVASKVHPVEPLITCGLSPSKFHSIPYFELFTTAGITLKVTPKDDYSLDDNLQVLATAAKQDTNARSRKEKWKDFWRMKATFNPVRYAMAMTAHRSQGSTYREVFVDSQDIWRNNDAEERLQCLNVSCTRPTTKITFL